MHRPPHLDQQYEAELQAIQMHLLRMGVRAETMVKDAVRSVMQREPELARQVIAGDRELDRLEVESDDLCLRLMARRAPVGEDLRLVTCALKAVTDMERIGDLAVNIAKRSLELYAEPGLEPVNEIQALSDKVVTELSEAMRALQERDSTLARSLRTEDSQADEINRAAFQRLIGIAKDHPDQFERALALTSICRHLERVGDHAVNIGEMVVFLVEGKVVRHAGDPASSPAA